MGISTRHSLSNAYFNKADFAMAARIEEGVLADRIALLGNMHPDTLNSYQHLARSYKRTGEWQSARDNLEHAYRIGGKIFSPDNKIYRDIATAYARLIRRLGYHQQAIEILSELLTENAQSPASTAQLLNHRGYTYFEMEMYTESRKDLEKANAILEEIYPDGSDTTLLPRANLGDVMTVTGDPEAGVALINRVIEENITQFGADDYGVAAWNLKLARIALRANDLDRAQALTELSRSLFLKTFSRNQSLVLESDEVEIQISLARGDRAQAVVQCKALLQRFGEVFPGDAPIIARYRNLLADLRRRG